MLKNVKECLFLFSNFDSIVKKEKHKTEILQYIITGCGSRFS